MAMAGVALDDAGHPAKWVAENSFGADCGTDGYVTLSDEWFARYLFRMVVERRFLQDSLQDCLSRKPGSDSGLESKLLNSDFYIPIFIFTKFST